jgi:hypothetical protein
MGEQQMTKSIGRHAAAATAVIALGGAMAVTTQESAQASAFSASYTCTVPVLGARPVTIHGSLTATPDRAAAGQPIRFRLRISRLSLQSPVAIDSWTAVAGIEVSGAQSAGFRVAGSGGALMPRQPISGDLFGAWTPRVRGVDRFRGVNVVITARVARLGVLTASCLPNAPRPVLETVSVLTAHRALQTRDDTDV